MLPCSRLASSDRRLFSTITFTVLRCGEPFDVMIAARSGGELMPVAGTEAGLGLRNQVSVGRERATGRFGRGDVVVLPHRIEIVRITKLGLPVVFHRCTPRTSRTANTVRVGISC